MASAHPYTGTQLSFAVSQLSSNKHIELVTLSIGGNDLLQFGGTCLNQTLLTFNTCVGQLLPVVLGTYGTNLVSILTALRSVYQGQLILVTQYVPNANPRSSAPLACSTPS